MKLKNFILTLFSFSLIQESFSSENSLLFFQDIPSNIGSTLIDRAPTTISLDDSEVLKSINTQTLETQRIFLVSSTDPGLRKKSINSDTADSIFYNALFDILSCDSYSREGESIKNPGEDTTKKNLSHTWLSTHISRETDAKQSLVISENEQNLIEKKNIIELAYSNKSIQSTQGEFEIINASKLFHTEPKALSKVLDVIRKEDHRLTKVILISKKDMCPCCTRLILGLLYSRRKTPNFPKDFFIVSQRMLSKFEDRLLQRIAQELKLDNSSEKKQAIKDAINKL